MKKISMVGLSALLLAGPAMARDTVVMVPLADVLLMPDAESKLDKSFKFYLAGDESAPKDARRVGEGITNKKTNAFNKSDEFACKWAVLSALIQLQEDAKREGANAIVDMVSYYKKRTLKNPTKIECHAGATVAGAALKGTYVKIDK